MDGWMDGNRMRRILEHQTKIPGAPPTKWWLSTFSAYIILRLKVATWVYQQIHTGYNSLVNQRVLVFPVPHVFNIFSLLVGTDDWRWSAETMRTMRPDFNTERSVSSVGTHTHFSSIE